MFVKQQSKNIACLLDVNKIKQVNNHHLPEKKLGQQKSLCLTKK